jgi:cytochrome c-type biogenesis protein CcmE
VQPGTRFRLGGLVKEGSVQRGENQQVAFEVMDGQSSIRVNYHGILPDLFREGQGVIAEGALEKSGIFRADSVLAKHDENYMPREVADTLRRQGVWQGDAKASQQAQ